MKKNEKFFKLINYFRNHNIILKAIIVFISIYFNYFNLFSLIVNLFILINN
jgi:hypothetical protein